MTNTTIPISLVPRISLETTQNIPRIIHQTFKTAKVPEGIFGAVSTWIDKNPEYAYEFYDDARMIDFIRNFDCTGFSFTNEQLNEAFDLIKPGAGKADIFRYCVLYVYGGIYSDIDSECLVPLKDFINKTDDIVVIINFWRVNVVHHVLSQWWMAYVKTHPVIKHTLELVVKSVLTRDPINCFEDTDNIMGLLEKFTGPAVYNKVFLDAMKIKIEKYRLERFNNISETVMQMNLLGSKSNVRFVHYDNHNDYHNDSDPVSSGDSIPKYVRFKYSDYPNDLHKLGLKSWSDDGQDVF